MKHHIRKAVSALCAVALLVSTLAVGGVGVYAENKEYYMAPNLVNYATAVNTTTTKSGNADRISDGTATTGSWEADHSVSQAYAEVEWKKPVEFGKIVVYFGGGTNALINKSESSVGFQYWDSENEEWVTISDATKVKSSISKVNSPTPSENGDKIFDATFDPVNNTTPTQGTDYYLQTGSAAYYHYLVTLPNAIRTSKLQVVASDFNVTPNSGYSFQIVELEVYQTPVNLALEEYRAGTNGNNLMSSAPVNNVFDGDTATSCGTSSTAGNDIYMSVYWAEAKTIKDIRVIRENDFDYWIETSADTTNGKGGTWTKVSRITTDTDTKTRTDTINIPVMTVKGVRLRAVGTTTRFKVKEFEIYSYSNEAEKLPTVVNRTDAITCGATNIALASNGGTAFASEERNATNGKVNLNNGACDIWSPIWLTDDEVKEGVTKTVYAGIQWETTKQIGSLTIYWRDTSNSPGVSDYIVQISDDGTEWKNVAVSRQERVIPTGSFASVAPHLTGTDNASRVGKDVIEFSAPVTAKAVRLEITHKIKQAQLAEIEVYEPGTSFNGIQAVCRDATTTGKKDMYVFTDISQICVPEDYVASVHVAITRNGEEKTTEDRLLWTAWEGVSLMLDGTSTEFTPADICETDHGTHVIGILLLNLLPTDEVNVTFDIVPIPPEE